MTINIHYVVLYCSKDRQYIYPSIDHFIFLFIYLSIYLFIIDLYICIYIHIDVDIHLYTSQYDQYAVPTLRIQ